MSTPAAHFETDPVPNLECPTCGTQHLRRLQRHGFMQKVVYSLLGYYPWECPICRVPVYLKKRH